MIDDTPKPKNTPGAVRRFQAALFIWSVVTLLLSYYPPLWIVPPYTHLTPFFYIGASLLWLPFGLRHIHRYGLVRRTRLFIAGCLLITLIMVKDYRELNPGMRGCDALEAGSSTYFCFEGCDYINYEYYFERPGNLPLMIMVSRHEWVNTAFSCRG